MKHDEAKFVLRACRPRGQDDQDPALRAALDAAARDPELAAWLERERAFDSAIGEKLRAVAPPAGLRESILAGAGLSAPRRPEWMQVWRQPLMWAVAAAVAVLVTVGLSFTRSAPTTAELESPEQLMELAQADLGPGFPTDVALGAEVGDIRRWLESPQNRLSAGMPFDVAELKRAGCRVIKAGRSEVYQICFDRGSRYHVYVVPRDRCRGVRPEDLPMLRQQGGLGFATWADAQYVYVLASSEGLDAVRSLL